MKSTKERGFTLVELLVVVGIIGILAALAIPQYANYKRNAVDATMKNDLHTAANALEAYYGSNNNAYNQPPPDAATLQDYGYRQSAAVSLTIAPSTDSYVLTAGAQGGSQPSWSFDSATGQVE